MTMIRFFIAMLCLGGLLTMSAVAQTRSWTTNSTIGDTGNWSDSTKWGGDVPDTSGENATFGAYANNRSVALDGNYTIGTLTIVPRTSGFSGTTFALTGNNTLTLTSGFVVGGGNSITIAPNLVIGADQVWTTQNETGAAPVTLTGIVSGTGRITRTANGANTSAGIITFSGANTFLGGFTQNATLNTTRLGISSTVSGGSIADGPLGTGTVTLNAGTLSSNGGTGRTLHNNIVIGGTVNLGNSAQTGALTFSDAGLTTASTFTLANPSNNGVTILRLGGTNIVFDQVIAESGGADQSVNFAATSGTPTVTLNRTKSAGGNILVGGVNLVLNNGAANSGDLMGVNGSITATGSNKFSDGALFADGTNLIATDLANYSAVDGKVSVYNNGRVSFATDQTQATVAGLFTSDSQIRLGLGSGSGSATVNENYNQSAIGNGRAGLVSASTGTMTYNGTLTAGSDNTYRVGGGAGTLALNNALTGTGNNLSVEGGGTVTSGANNTYTGTTTLNGTTLTISGASGSLSGTSSVAVNAGSSLNLTNNTGATNANRINDTASISLSNSSMTLGGTSTGALSETVGNLTFEGGRSTVTVATTPAASTIKTLQFGTITRNNNALAIIRGDALGSGTARNEIKVSSAPTLVGGGGAAGTTNISILPWARGLNSSAGAPNTFVTYDASTGFRPLNTTTEFVQANNTTRVDQAIVNAGNGTDYNVRYTTPTNASSTVLNTASTSVTVNSFILDASGASGGVYTHGLNSGTINVTSGALLIRQTSNQNMTVNGGTFAFGSAEGVITVEANTAFLSTLGTSFTGSGGFTIYTQNNSTVSLAGSNTVNGTFTFGGPGIIAVDQDSRFGNAANNLVHAGGGLQFFAGFTSTRGLTLLGNVGDNSLFNNSTSTMTWNGDISGAGRLRLANNATTPTTIGFSLGGNNTYTGGTQIEGINVTASSNSALGTGTVTLVGANNNAAALNVTAASATLGGLRGTDGTVTINPSGTSATLTVGSNNENTVFNGVIAQGAGKTGALTKTGNGTLVLGGSNTYTGNTTVSQGTLLVNGSLASANVNVATGGVLGGSGRISGTTRVQIGGTLSPGNSPGLPQYGNLVLETGSDFRFELVANTTSGRGTNFDGVDILAGGTLTIQTGVDSDLVFNATGSTVNWSNAFWATDQSWLVFDTADNNYAGNVLAINSVSLDSAGQSLASIRSGAGFSYSVSGGDLYLNYTAIPEPSTTLLLFVGIAVILRRKARMQA